MHGECPIARSAAGTGSRGGCSVGVRPTPDVGARGAVPPGTDAKPSGLIETRVIYCVSSGMSSSMLHATSAAARTSKRYRRASLVNAHNSRVAGGMQTPACSPYGKTHGLIRSQ
jgi:hypothetical protein